MELRNLSGSQRRSELQNVGKRTPRGPVIGKRATNVADRPCHRYQDVLERYQEGRKDLARATWKNYNAVGTAYEMCESAEAFEAKYGLGEKYTLKELYSKINAETAKEKAEKKKSKGVANRANSSRGSADMSLDSGEEYEPASRGRSDGCGSEDE
jgi:hypothetical protein